MAFALAACMMMLAAGCSNNVGPGVAGFGGFGVSGFGVSGFSPWGFSGFGASGFTPWGFSGFGGPAVGFGCPPGYVCSSWDNRRMCMPLGALTPPPCFNEGRVCNNPLGGICREVRGQPSCVVGC